MGKRHAVGLDLGGTDVKAALVSEGGEILARKACRTRLEGGAEAVLSDMAGLAEAVMAQAGVPAAAVAGVGIGSPGPLSPRRGTIIRAANLPPFENVPLRDEIGRRTGLPTVLANDGNAAAYGEFWVGAGRDVAHMVLLTLGTGVGAGVIIEGRLLGGHFENAAELGHTIVEVNGRPCSCGQRGCLEQYASAGNVARRAVEAVREGAESVLSGVPGGPERLTSEDVVEAVRRGDALATGIWEDACRYLGMACVNIERAFNPAVIALGGGMSAAGSLLVERVRRYRDSLRWSLLDDIAEIVPARLGNDAGVMGAAGLLLHAVEEG